ncbi:3-beta hydroxysteroid dehydrogenase/isomerase [Apiospora marii]|uniref:3-beta hydroxysteroid dehydrogenase/isomerase n=1 Tax=Apiospora marii TaxID=335849 RepID=A0ABR1RM33_9PEZI
MVLSSLLCFTGWTITKTLRDANQDVMNITRAESPSLSAELGAGVGAQCSTQTMSVISLGEKENGATGKGITLHRHLVDGFCVPDVLPKPVTGSVDGVVSDPDKSHSRSPPQNLRWGVDSSHSVDYVIDRRLSSPITGITGYIGFQTLTIALERGYNVRGVVRSESSIASLRSKSDLISRSEADGTLDFAIIPYFLQKDMITSTLNDIRTIVHIASPLATQADDYDAEIIQPAVSMVTVVLEAAAATPSVRRVVITSSCVTLVPFEWNFAPDSERLYTQLTKALDTTANDLNSDPKGPYGSPMEAYWASKALARIATRDFMAERQPHFDFVNLLPSVVIGPDTRITPGARPEDLAVEARGAVLASALTADLNSPFPYVGVPVHVRDVARAHVDAADEARVPGNAEYILSSDTPEGVVWDRDTALVAKKYFEDAVRSREIPLEGSLAAIKWRLDAGKTEETFGWKMTSFEQTMKEMLDQYLQLARGTSL